jgi:hypothetical protein
MWMDNPPKAVRSQWRLGTTLAAGAAPLPIKEASDMDPKSGKPLRLFVNPFAIWTNLALKTGEAMIASAHAVAAEAKARRIAVIPAADAPARKVKASAAPAVKPARRAASSKAAPPKARSKAKRQARAKIKARARR